MKYIRYMLSIMIPSLLVAACIGCSSTTISRKEYNNLLDENAKLKTKVNQYDNLLVENAELKEQITVYNNKLVNTKVVGGFSVKVRGLIPDYCLDNITPAVAVVTCFQDGPFTIYLGEERAKELSIGETYYFELEETEIGQLTESEFNNGWADPRKVIWQYGVPIKTIRLAKDDELGLESIKLHFVKIDS